MAIAWFIILLLGTAMVLATAVLIFTLIYIVIDAWQSSRRAYSHFRLAWDHDEYTVRPINIGSENYLRVEFNQGKATRYFDIDETGQMITPILWENEGGIGKRPKKRLKEYIRPHAEQIVMMFKLEHGDLQTVDPQDQVWII